MPRLTRAESQARTRAKLLSTAKACFLRDGYEATSIDSVAEAAGFSKGAVYSNFESKDALCLAVLDARRVEEAQSLAAAILGCESLEERLAAFERWAETHIGNRAWTALEIEFAIHAARDPSLALQLVRRDRDVRSFVSGVVAQEARERGLTPPMSNDDVALALLSLGIGLGVQRALDPDLSVKTLGQLLRLFATHVAPSSVPDEGRKRKPR